MQSPYEVDIGGIPSRGWPYDYRHQRYSFIEGGLMMQPPCEVDNGGVTLQSVYFVVTLMMQSLCEVDNGGVTPMSVQPYNLVAV